MPERIIEEQLLAGLDQFHLDVTLTRYGGHCGFVESRRLDSRIDRVAVDYFSGQLGRPQASG